MQISCAEGQAQSPNKNLNCGIRLFSRPSLQDCILSQVWDLAFLQHFLAAACLLKIIWRPKEQFLTRGKRVLSAIKVSEATLLSASLGSVREHLKECLQRAGLSLGIKNGIFPTGQNHYTDLFLIYSP